MSRIDMGDRQIELSNTEKVFFDEIGATKGDVIEHYERLAEHALAHVADRPLVLERFPDGVHHDGFFQKNAGAHFLDWIPTVALPTDESGTTSYVVADDPSTFVYLANQGTVVCHTLLGTGQEPRIPEELVFDLDPPSDDDLGP